MPQIILGPGLSAMDGSLHQATYRFLTKLAADDTAPGLHIEPINNSADPRARTGRVDISNRAVLFKLQGSQQSASYVFIGTFQHDDAIAIAQKSRVNINPRNGVAELIPVDDQPTFAAPTATAQPRSLAVSTDAEVDGELSLRAREFTVADFTDLGIEAAFAEGALDLCSSDAVLDYAEQAPAAWQASALLDIYTGESLTTVREKYQLDEPDAADATNDDDVLAALKHPAAQMEFAFIDDDEALRAAIENPDFAAWSIFLHPEQREYTTRNFNGPFRLSGGAGTGKTVVLLHRARELHRRNPEARIVLTTYNRTLAEALKSQLAILDSSVTIASDLGKSGIYIAGVDAIAARMLGSFAADLSASGESPGSVAQVVGSRAVKLNKRTHKGSWKAAVTGHGDALGSDLRTASFFEAEYAMVVLPCLVTTREEYLKVRRTGRGVSLNRARRNAVWDVIEAYRAAAAADGTLDFEEKSAVAAQVLRSHADEGLADHVLVDEAQDLSPSRLMLLRALAAPGQNDLFIAEDSHQRIYGQPIVLGRYDISIVGRSRRLTLNYRTTEQNLRYALGILSGAEYTDLDDEPDSTEGYRSARRGPRPNPIAANSLTDEYDIVARTVSGWLDGGVDPETIGLLVPTLKEGESLPQELSDRGVSVTFVDRDTAGISKTPQVMTMHRAKGMEFAKVVLVGVGAKNVPRTYFIDVLPKGDRADALRRERSLLYVAATRARDELVVVYAGQPSSLLPGRTVEMPK
ncbi:MAG: 3'-5' exonuclease [Rhodococcus sp. (in: high G+C Gram-positive bacteria)]|uniref:3'-5' exonuclease n=1 Tax=Rhodococcus sp. TaxID=1831 RepID=UPI003BB5725E